MSERCFISVDIDDKPLQKRLEKVQEGLARYGRNKPTSPGQFHTTINFIGDLEEEQILDVKQQLRNVSFTPFTMKVKGLGAFPSEDFIKVVWTGIESDDLVELAETVRDTLPEDLAEDRAFHPHITLLRLHNISRDEKAKLRETINQRREEEFGHFDVDAFRLKKSELTENGAEHQVIEEYSSNEAQ